MAKGLLYDNKLSIVAVSEACGFPDVSHFFGVFGNIVGVPASQWRKEYATNVSSIEAGVAPERLRGENTLGGDDELTGG